MNAPWTLYNFVLKMYCEKRILIGATKWKTHTTSYSFGRETIAKAMHQMKRLMPMMNTTVHDNSMNRQQE